MWLQKPKRRPRVEVISKTVCPLCDHALEDLEGLMHAIPHDLEVTKIEDDENLAELYKYEVPVIFIDGKKRFFGKVDPQKLRRALKIASRSANS